jgi:serine/threonine protein kinase
MPHTLIDGRYELQRQLGRGGMGVVWEAYDNRLSRQVAVKELLFRGALDPDTQAQWVERARREAQAIARIGHEHVVAVHDVIEAEGQVWIVMEQVNPHSLADQLREQGRLPALHAARIGLEVLRGLRAVHAAGVLHRDVKPHNILFRRDGRAVLMDFGIATFEGAAQVTRLHETVGTPQYLAPELSEPASRTPREATPAADLWSLGVTLYETVEGRAPFRGPTPYEVLEAVRTTEPPPMEHAGPLRPLIEGLLVKEPTARLTAERAEQLLQHVAQETPHPLAGYPTGYDPQATQVTPPLLRPDPTPDPAQPPRPFWSRRRWVAATAGVVGLAVLATAGWFAVDRLRTPDGTSLSSSATYRAAKQHGYLVIGVKSDQPGLSEHSATAVGGYEGFDIDLAWAIAKKLGFSQDQVHFLVVDTQSREYRLRSGQVDLIVASYSITKQRKESVDFAGPYYTAGQDFLVRVDEKGVHNTQDLYGHDVCTVTDSTPAERLRTRYPQIRTELRPSYGQCVDQLLAGKVDAVSTDDIILAGYRALHPKQLKLLGVPFGEEEYGVGLHKDEPALKSAVCAAIRDEISSGRWEASYVKHLKPQTTDKGLNDQRPPDLSECG